VSTSESTISTIGEEISYKAVKLIVTPTVMILVHTCVQIAARVTNAPRL
jgi:hypothetical protein